MSILRIVKKNFLRERRKKREANDAFSVNATRLHAEKKQDLQKKRRRTRRGDICNYSQNAAFTNSYGKNKQNTRNDACKSRIRGARQIACKFAAFSDEATKIRNRFPGFGMQNRSQTTSETFVRSEPSAPKRSVPCRLIVLRAAKPRIRSLNL